MTTTLETPLPRWRTKRNVEPSTPLTDRETTVLELVSRGHSNPQIGKQLFITENSVKTLLKSAYVRLGARDRAHAVRLGFETGVLTADGAAS